MKSAATASSPPTIIKPDIEAPTKPKRGRKPIQIDLELLKNLASIQCTLSEMSAALGVSVDTLHRNFADTIAIGKENGKKSLRRIQVELAKKSPAMAIFLGKQYLGQKDEERNAPQYTKITVERG